MGTLELSKNIIKKASMGDLDAFEKIFNTYEQYVLNLSSKIINDTDKAHDIKQEVFLKIYKSLATYKEEYEFKTWISRIAVNTALSYKSKKDKQLNIIENIKSFLLPQHGNMEETIENKDMVQRIFKKLPKIYRSLLFLREVEELPYDKISKILNCSVPSVKIKLFRARKKFQEEKEFLTARGEK